MKHIQGIQGFENIDIQNNFDRTIGLRFKYTLLNEEGWTKQYSKVAYLEYNTDKREIELSDYLEMLSLLLSEMKQITEKRLLK